MTTRHWTVLKLSGEDLGPDPILVRCDLTEASAPVEINCDVDGDGDTWDSTQFQCADTRHSVAGLATIARRLAAWAAEMPEDEFDCQVEEVE